MLVIFLLLLGALGVFVIIHGADNWLDNVLQFLLHFFDFIGLSGLKKNVIDWAPQRFRTKNYNLFK